MITGLTDLLGCPTRCLLRYLHGKQISDGTWKCSWLLCCLDSGWDWKLRSLSIWFVTLEVF